VFGVIGLIAVVSLLFILAKRKRDRANAAEGAAAAGDYNGAAGPGDEYLDGAGEYGPEGIIAGSTGGPEAKYPGAPGGGNTYMPALAPLAGGMAGASGGAGTSDGDYIIPRDGNVESAAAVGPSSGNGGAVLSGIAAAGAVALVTGSIAERHRRKESIQLRPTPAQSNTEQVFGAGHSTHGDSSTESLNQNPLLAVKRTSTKFFMSGRDSGPPRRSGPPSPTTAVPPVPVMSITTDVSGAKTEQGTADEEAETVEVISREEHERKGGFASGDASMAGGAMILGAAGAAVIAAHHSSSDGSSKVTSETTTGGGSLTTSKGGVTKTTTTEGGVTKTTTTTITTKLTSGTRPRPTVIQSGETQEILHSTSQDALDDDVQGHNRLVSNASTGMVVSGGNTSTSSLVFGSSTSSSSISSQSAETPDGSSSSKTVTRSGKKTTTTTTTTMSTSTSSSALPAHLLEGMVAVGTLTAGGILTQTQKQQQQRVIVQQGPPQVSTSSTKTQITLKLSIVRYERSDADKATPDAKPGTLMFSQVEMIEGAKDILIAGSAYSHVRDSSKITGQEQGLPSPVVPGPSGAGSNNESEPREQSLRWMKDEFQWKREAGMLQHLASEKHIVELFTLYTLPPFAEYRFVSVMGPFTRTLESYIRVRKGIIQPTTPSDEALALQGPMTLQELKALTDSVASAIKWCHERHVVHLNLSPSSIILQEVYSEPDGQGGYRASTYSTYSTRTSSDALAPKIEQRWKLWNFNHARFIGESADLGMETTAYSSPEVLIPCRRYHKRLARLAIKAEVENPNRDAVFETVKTSDGTISRTEVKTSTSSSSTSISTSSSGEPIEKLVALPTMDMWSLGQIVYELHTCQPMFTSDEDALVKLGEHKKAMAGLETPAPTQEDDEDDAFDLDQARTHDKIRSQLQLQISKIDEIQDTGAQEVIRGLLEMQQERRLDHQEIRDLYLDVQDD